MRRELLDLADTAAYLTTTERHVRRLVYERRIAFVKIGSKLRFDPRDLDAWIDKNRVESKAVGQ